MIKLHPKDSLKNQEEPTQENGKLSFRFLLILNYKKKKLGQVHHLNVVVA